MRRSGGSPWPGTRTEARLLVADGQAFPALGSAGCDHTPASWRPHADAETVLLRPLAPIRLVCSFRHLQPLLRSPAGRQRRKLPSPQVSTRDRCLRRLGKAAGRCRAGRNPEVGEGGAAKALGVRTGCSLAGAGKPRAASSGWQGRGLRESSKAPFTGPSHAQWRTHLILVTTTFRNHRCRRKTLGISFRPRSSTEGLQRLL